MRRLPFSGPNAATSIRNNQRRSPTPPDADVRRRENSSCCRTPECGMAFLAFGARNLRGVRGRRNSPAIPAGIARSIRRKATPGAAVGPCSDSTEGACSIPGSICSCATYNPSVPLSWSSTSTSWATCRLKSSTLVKYLNPWAFAAASVSGASFKSTATGSLSPS